MMTREADYAVRALILSAIYNRDNLPLNTAIMAERMNIPYRFLRKIMISLSENGYIKTKKGRFGGLKINRNPSEVSLLDVVGLFSSSAFYLNKCTKENRVCDGRKECKLHSELNSIQADLNKKLALITIDKLI